MIAPDSVGKIADATKAVADTSGKAIDVFASLGSVVKAPIEDLVGIVSDRVKYVRWKGRLALVDKAQAVMRGRGLKSPTRELPLPFAVPLLTHAILEENDELQNIWATLLVNAGDASTEMELRTAYVEILAGMTAFDVKNLSIMASVSAALPQVVSPVLETWNLPKSAKLREPFQRELGAISMPLGISLANLARLGCAMPGSGFDAGLFFNLMTVTDLGMALYKACS